MMGSLMIAILLAGCGTDELKDDIAVLKNRVENLEAIVDKLNKNVQAVQTLLDNNKTIKNYTVEDNTYTLTLSDGSTITLTQGKMGEVVMPEISINGDGFWVINGNVQTIKASGNDGQTPKFQISTDGYWQISFDGKPFDYVLDEKGQHVKAALDEGSGSGSSFFTEVNVVGDMLVVKIKSGESCSLPIVTDLAATITAPGSDYENGVWYIAYGGTVTTEVIITGENYFVTVPAGGWVASVSEPDVDGKATLTVTAPMQTRATADNSTELVLQVNKGAYWAIDKIKVQACTAANTPYDIYSSGRNLVFDGIIVNKSKFGEARLLTENYTFTGDETRDGVYFLQDGVTLTMPTTSEFDFNHLIVIGNGGERKANFEIIKSNGDMSYFKAPIDNREAGYYIWNNVTISNQGAIRPETRNSEYHFVFDDCKIQLSPTTSNMFTLWNLTNYNTKLNISVVNNTFEGFSAKEFISGNNAECENLGTLKIENNLFYSNEVGIYKLATVNSSNNSLKWYKIQLTHNTFVNVEPGSNSPYLKCSGVTNEYICTYNIFYLNTEMAAGRCIFHPLDYQTLDKNLAGSVKCNIGYKASGNKKWDLVWYNKIPVADFETLTMLEGDASPFAKMDYAEGIFVPTDEYSDYGYTEI